MRNFKKAFKGFTLVEVLIVIIIIGILIAALLPRLTGSQARARDVARSAMVNQIANGLSLFINDQGTIGATSWSSSGTCLIHTNQFTGANGTSLGGTMSSIPKDPQGSHANLYCLGSAWVMLESGANSNTAIVFADLEGVNGANVLIPTNAVTGDNATETNFQTWVNTSGSDGFGAFVRG